MSEPQGCLGIILKLLGLFPEQESEHKEPWPYDVHRSLLTSAERHFFKTLHPLVVDYFHLHCMVRMADILKVRSGTSNWQSMQNRINAKHIDFLLCEFETHRPVLAIELDDSSHGRPDRVKRDIFVNEIFVDAGLPLLRIQTAQKYDPMQIQNAIRECLNPPTD